jgi:hypothetical protein
MKGKVKVKGWFKAVCRNPDGSVAWKDEFPNGATTVGLNYLLNTGFGGSLYAGLIDNSGYSAVATADTMSSHAGWTESTVYDEATRVSWGHGTAASGVMTNASGMDFTASSSATIKGAFLTTVSTKADTSGTLLATGVLSTPQLIVAGQVLELTYTYTLTPA